MTNLALERLISRIDRAEFETATYVLLAEVSGETTQSIVDAAVRDQVILVDTRNRLSLDSAELEQVTVCRVNRHHPLVRAVLASDEVRPATKV